jgi:hypothetical protein
MSKNCQKEILGTPLPLKKQKPLFEKRRFLFYIRKNAPSLRGVNNANNNDVSAQIHIYT